MISECVCVVGGGGGGSGGGVGWWGRGVDLIKLSNFLHVFGQTG